MLILRGEEVAADLKFESFENVERLSFGGQGLAEFATVRASVSKWDGLLEFRYRRKAKNFPFVAKIKDAGGKATLKTVEGEDLTFERGAGHLWVIDAKGDKAEVTIPNVMQSNGVSQVINKVLLPG